MTLGRGWGGPIRAGEDHQGWGSRASSGDSGPRRQRGSQLGAVECASRARVLRCCGGVWRLGVHRGDSVFGGVTLPTHPDKLGQEGGKGKGTSSGC